jgi:NAD-dependent DNA ligase
LNEKIFELITRRRRQILVHSFLYYQLNESIIEDSIFDLWSKELAELQQQYPEESAKAIYAKDFGDFDGSSGYDLPYSYPEIQNVGYRLLRIAEKYR